MRARYVGEVEGGVTAFCVTFPGDGSSVEVADDFASKVKGSRYFEIEEDASPASTGPEPEDRDENGDTQEMAEMRRRFDEAYARQASEIERLNGELAARDATIEELRAAQASAGQQQANPAEGEQDPPKPAFSVKDKGRGWNVVVDGEGKELTKSLRDDAVAGFDAKSDEDKAAFVAANKAEN